MSRVSAFPLIVLFFLLSCAFFSVQGCLPFELKALLRFRSAVNDTAGMLESWKGDDCCAWDGVECTAGTPKRRHVSKLDLHNFDLTSVNGETGSSLFELKGLDYLDLSGNVFAGEIPSQLGNLSSLRHLDLSSYSDDICLTSSNLHWLFNLSSLEYLSLSGVGVKEKNWGNIIGSLLRLEHLDLSSCSLPLSTIPSTLINLSSLAFLDLSSNSFSNIPTWMEKLPFLTHLNLARNKITGNIPNTIGNVTSLQYLDLSDNVLTGSLPLSLSKLFSLTLLDASNNHLSGSLPSSFAHLPSLTYLDVSSNNLNGSIPSALMLPSSLQVLFLSNNYMNGTITEVFFHKSFKLKLLDLSQCGLSIKISSTWIPPFQLQAVGLKKCKTGGPIPSWISTQFSLAMLDLSASQSTYGKSTFLVMGY